MPAELLVVGVDHTTAPVALRERLAFTGDETPAALGQLVSECALEQAAILSTCNRVEVYGVARRRGAGAAVAEFVAGYHRLRETELADALYTLHGDDVAHRLAATAAGVHSLVLGEAQIQGQVRGALELAARAGTARAELQRLFETALVAGRRVRARTSIGRGVASVSHAAVELARQRLGDLRGATVLLIGTGKVSELVAKHLDARLIVAGRDQARARALGGAPITMERLADGVARADVVISSTAAPEAVLGVREVERARRDVLLIDLAVPRDVDPAVAALPGVRLVTLDDLGEVVAQTLARRAAELPQAYALIHREVKRFTAWLNGRQAAAAVNLLRPEAEALRAREVAEIASRLPAGDREAVEEMSRALVDGVLDATSVPLRHAIGAQR
jgi:glutamyl-tRNA reductase